MVLPRGVAATSSSLPSSAGASRSGAGASLYPYRGMGAVAEWTARLPGQATGDGLGEFYRPVEWEPPPGTRDELRDYRRLRMAVGDVPTYLGTATATATGRRFRPGPVPTTGDELGKYYGRIGLA